MAGSEPNTDSRWYALGVDEVINSFDSNRELGLTDDVAAAVQSPSGMRRL